RRAVPISLELALPHADLARGAGAALPAREAGPAPPPPYVRHRAGEGVELTPRPRRPSLLVAVATLMAASFIGLPSAGAGLRAGADTVVHTLRHISSAQIR